MFDTPTLFRFASGGAFKTGLMGEAGPEAVMPLVRGRGGKLGVQASAQGSSAPTINITQTINVGEGVSLGQVAAAGQQSKLETIAAIRRMYRGGTL